MTADVAAGRQAALTRRVAVTIAVSTGGYTIATADGATLRRATLPTDISLSTTCPAATCAFDRRGVPTAAGTITLASASTGRSFTIRIEAGTGRVSSGEP